MRDIILSSISMQQVLDKYGIKNNQKVFCCPFHDDKHPSAKIYNNSYCCFACNKADTTIGFVMDLFHLSFKEAMQKINLDFNLGLDSNYEIDYDKLNKIKSEQYERRKIQERQRKKYCELCDVRFIYQKILKHFKEKKITINNWESLTMIISDIETKLFQIENSLQILDEKLSSRI
jgi:DNA primase